MRATPTAVPSLGRWGLSAHADLVFRALTLDGPSTSGWLARHLDVAAARIDRALDELAACGAAAPGGTGPQRLWTAGPPAEVIDRLRRRREPILVAEQARRHLGTVTDLRLERLLPGAVRRLPSRSLVRDRIAELAGRERHEHLAINTEDVITADAKAVADPLDRALIARGVRMRSVGLPARDGSVAPAPPGAEFRIAQSLPIKLMIFDRRVALIPADPLELSAGAVEIADPEAVAQLVGLYDRVWSAAESYRREVPTIELNTRERAVVTMLAAGATEEAAAVRLGLSRRTVVTTLRVLMDRLGVENRFQLALILGAAHAIPLPPAGTPAANRTEEES
ncbi:LuxR C-terminal-related transcriptional regulator [Paractinoplanes rishiriensis]|uniref:Transcriptional regulator n=1 Tax=Paractinoplanes rishiriensis TaxID=1050105 RepID=A0A919N2B0_9ACTN|nr:LuxR C-terminal-related transcriptional regulator [Actinoplanes rishiriensis]GIE99187.1 transcriptional regulator [Actinoplanes rishiriensis]